MMSGFLFWDKVLICAFIIFIVALGIGALYVNVPVIQLWFIRKTNALIERLNAFSNQINDWDEYDAEWMDAKKWKETNI